MSVQEIEDVDCEDCGCYGTSGFICESCANKRVKKALSASQAEVEHFKDEANGVILRKNKRIMELEKRLLAKSEVEKK